MAAEAQAASDTPARIAQSRTSPNRRRSTLIEPASIAGRPAAAARLWKKRLGGAHRTEPVLSLFVVFSASIITSPSPTMSLLETREARMKQSRPMCPAAPARYNAAPDPLNAFAAPPAITKLTGPFGQRLHSP